MAGLQREVLKWLQSLDLTWQVKIPKWDFTNGYLIAEIFSWYYPQEIQMHMYNNGQSLDSKQKNWDLLINFIKRNKIDIPEDLIDGTLHCRDDAAQLLTERLYEILTNRQIRKAVQDNEVDFKDTSYQTKLPMHARSTATQAVKNNLKSSELVADKNMILAQQKAQSIISAHIDHRRQERLEDPTRFNKKPTLGELCPREAPPSTQPIEQVTSNGLTQQEEHETLQGGMELSQDIQEVTGSGKNSVQFKEITVKQLSREGQPMEIPMNYGLETV